MLLEKIIIAFLNLWLTFTLNIFSICGLVWLGLKCFTTLASRIYLVHHIAASGIISSTVIHLHFRQSSSFGLVLQHLHLGNISYSEAWVIELYGDSRNINFLLVQSSSIVIVWGPAWISSRFCISLNISHTSTQQPEFIKIMYCCWVCVIWHKTASC